MLQIINIYIVSKSTNSWNCCSQNYLYVTVVPLLRLYWHTLQFEDLLIVKIVTFDKKQSIEWNKEVHIRFERVG